MKKPNVGDAVRITVRVPRACVVPVLPGHMGMGLLGVCAEVVAVFPDGAHVLAEVHNFDGKGSAVRVTLAPGEYD